MQSYVYKPGKKKVFMAYLHNIQEMHLHLASVISPSLHCCYLRETVHNLKEKKEKLK